MIKKLLEIETVRFVICAGIYNVLSTLINWLFLYLGVNYLVCTTIGYISGILMAYLLNTKFVFNKEYNWTGFIKFISVYVSNYFITMGITWLLVDIFGINEYAAPVICIAFGFVYNYCLSKVFVYKDKSK